MATEPQSRRERGAALLEFALVAPVLLLLIFGAIEYGMFFKDYLTVSNTTRTGARVASAAGSSADADYQIIQAVKAAATALPGGAASVQQVSIYKSTSAGGGPSTTCQTTSVTNSCNTYTAGVFSQPASMFGCGAGSVDSAWCPTTRVDSQAIGPDYVGVWLKTTHGFITKLFGSSRTITDDVVMRIEPKMP